MRRTLLIVSVVYVLVLGHFLASNYVRVIGPNYLIKSQGYVRDYDVACMHYGSHNGCTYNCPDNTPSRPDYNFKGFPFATNQGVNVCNQQILPFQASSFNMARILNAVYIVLVTLICLSALRQTAPLPEEDSAEE